MIAEPVHALLQFHLRAARRDRTRGDEALDVACVVLDAVGANRETEILGRDVLELMRFVHDGVGASRDHFAERVLPDGGIGA